MKTRDQWIREAIRDVAAIVMLCVLVVTQMNDQRFTKEDEEQAVKEIHDEDRAAIREKERIRVEFERYLRQDPRSRDEGDAQHLRADYDRLVRDRMGEAIRE